MRRCRVLLTGFQPFGGWPGNPSADVVGDLGRDAGLRRLGLQVAVLPVHRTRAPLELLALLSRHQPETLVLTGLAAGRRAISLERLAVNCWRRAGDEGVGTAVERGGPDGLFSTLPLQDSLRALQSGGAPAVLSESAGTFCCNLVLYRALRWSAAGALPGGGGAPRRVGFVHLPATAECLPEGRSEVCVSRESLAASLRSLVTELAGTPTAPRHARPGGRSR